MPDNERKKSSLSPEFIKKLLTKKDSSTPDQTSKKWPGQVNMVALANAANNHQTVVVFRSGRVFKIRYHPELYVNDDNPRGCVWISPLDRKEFVPCGYITFKQMNEAVLLDGTNARTGTTAS
jgi:hypothetical protein